MKILRRYRAVDVSRTGVTAHDILRLLRCGLTDITMHFCFNIDNRALLMQLREFGAENAEVNVSLHVVRSSIRMWLYHRPDLAPYFGNICIYDDSAPSPMYDLLANMPPKEGEGRVCHVCSRTTHDAPSGADRCDDCGMPTCAECEVAHCDYFARSPVRTLPHRCCAVCFERYTCPNCSASEIQGHNDSSYRGVKIAQCRFCPRRTCQNCPSRVTLCVECRAWLCPDCARHHAGTQCAAVEQSIILDSFKCGNPPSPSELQRLTSRIVTLE